MLETVIGFPLEFWTNAAGQPAPPPTTSQLNHPCWHQVARGQVVRAQRAALGAEQVWQLKTGTAAYMRQYGCAMMMGTMFGGCEVAMHAAGAVLASCNILWPCLERREICRR